MKLLYLSKSPYTRKVRVLAYETGLNDQIELQEVDPNLAPVSPDRNLVDKNPIGKIPTLVLDDGSAIFDSRVICEYLDTLHDGPRMFPREGEARWRVLTRQALADGILDAAVLTRYELALRPEQYRWSEWSDGQKAKFRRALDVLERDAVSMRGTVDMGSIAAGCALAYLDFRFAAESWRDGRPALAAWYEEFSARESMQASRPQ